MLMGKSLARELLIAILEIKWYAIVADETMNISNDEQLPLSIRWLISHT